MDKKYTIITLGTCLIVLLMQYFLSASGVAGTYLSKLPYLNTLPGDFAHALGWGIFTLGMYTLPPFAAIYLIKGKPDQFGFSFNADAKHIVLVAPFILLPIAFIFSKDPDFQNTYPFLRHPDSVLQFIIWEMVYVLQFLGLEFFFRGFLLHSVLAFVKPGMAIFLATLPYTAIHFVKPLPEAISSFFGGLFLCWLALKYKGIGIGLYLHVILAVSMDCFVLYHKGWFN